MKTKIIRIAVTLIVSLLFVGSGISAAENTGETVNFKWAFIYKKTGEPYGRILDFNEKATVNSGDKLQVMLTPITQSYMYLYLLNSSNELDIIFPSDLAFYDKNKLGEESYLPAKDKWYSIDEAKGTERFYLLASSSRLTELEKATEEYLASGKNNDQKAALLDLMKSLRSANSTLASIAEKGVPIAGTFRTRGHGDVSVVLGDAIEVNAEKFYSKTIRLKHE